MSLSNIPVVLEGYALQITEAPTLKMKIDDKTRQETPATGRDGAQLFTVRLFAKPPADPTGRRGKGEEIGVTLVTDPGDEFEEGDRVKEGQFLLQIDPNILRGSVQRGEAAVAGARSGLEQAHVGVQTARANLTLAQDQAKRQRELWKDGLKIGRAHV